MHFLLAALVMVTSLLLTLFSYVHLLYTERGRFLIRGSKDNVEFFENDVEPRLKQEAEEAELTFPLLVQLDLVVLTLSVALGNLEQPLPWRSVGAAVVFLALDVVLFAQVIPTVLLTRTRGKWLLPAIGLLRVSVLAVKPLVVTSRFLHSIATLGREEKAEQEEPSPSENIEALMLAGEEEGLLETDDRKLIRSVVEFGDKTVREVMTPRPEIFAVPVQTTVSALRQMLATRRFSRIPVYEEDLDHIVGFVHVRDLFLRSDATAAQQSVRGLLRSLTFVPETKPIAELLKEMQQKTQIAIVVDEYGSVAGLVSVEDIVEEIVGEIREEHEVLDAIPQEEGAFSVPGNMDVDRLHDLFGVRVEKIGGATTVSGLVTSILGRVPSPGETLQQDGLTFQVIESNGRRVLRLLVTGPAEQSSPVIKSSQENSTDPEDHG
ncbi:MAG: CBS domain-containing protein [Acidobacteria bacterium]|nr:CBS domain-containing protein [Acidobacteriota bacterium]